MIRFVYTGDTSIFRDITDVDMLFEVYRLADQVQVVVSLTANLLFCVKSKKKLNNLLLILIFLATYDILYKWTFVYFSIFCLNWKNWPDLQWWSFPSPPKIMLLFSGTLLVILQQIEKSVKNICQKQLSEYVIISYLKTCFHKVVTNEN